MSTKIKDCLWSSAARMTHVHLCEASTAAADLRCKPLADDTTRGRLERATKTNSDNKQKSIQPVEHAETIKSLPGSQDFALLPPPPFRGQVRVAIRASKVLEEKASFGALCCVSPCTGDLLLLDSDDLEQVLLRVPLEYLAVTMVHIFTAASPSQTHGNNTSSILHVQVETNLNVNPSSFFLAPASRAAADEWGLLLSSCNVPVYSISSLFALSSTSRRSEDPSQRTKGIHEYKRRRNILNGSRPLVYWIKG